MPLYEFLCRNCQCQFEALVRHDEQAECPQCSSRETQRKLSLPGIPLVASGTASSCAPELPPCGPGCCRLPS